MNLLEYRAMKAEEERQKDTQVEVQPDVQTQPSATEPAQEIVPETPKTEPIPPAESVQADAPQMFEINGEQVTLDELQRGYLRQSDYTKKTQEVARKERELRQAQEIMQKVQANPTIAEQVGFNAEQARVDALQAELFDLRLQHEVSTLSTKYADFDVNEVVDFAVSRQMENLEDAYLLNKQYKTQHVPQQLNTSLPTQPAQTVDVEALKAQLRAELQAELNTNSIIGGGGQAPTPQQEVVLTEQEKRIAKMMGLSDADYLKWR